MGPPPVVEPLHSFAALWRWLRTGVSCVPLGSAPARTPLPLQSVGKTSIITRFVYDKFDAQYQARVWGPPQDSAAPPPLPSCAEMQLHPLLPGCRRPLA